MTICTGLPSGSATRAARSEVQRVRDRLDAHRYHRCLARPV